MERKKVDPSKLDPSQKREFGREHVGLQGSLQQASLPHDPPEPSRIPDPQDEIAAFQPDSHDRSVEETDLSVEAALETFQPTPPAKKRPRRRT